MRHFTVDEANALLPTIRPVVEDLQALRSQLEDAIGAVKAFEHLAVQNGHSEELSPFTPEQDVAAIQGEIRQRLAYLEGIGIHLKNIEEGILDFPARMFGRDVYLCWRQGEEEVGFWHDLDAGFRGRQPL